MSTTHLSRGRFGMIENEVEAENPSRGCEKLVDVGPGRVLREKSLCFIFRLQHRGSYRQQSRLCVSLVTHQSISTETMRKRVRNEIVT
jgi:hypothetical protein